MYVGVTGPIGVGKSSLVSTLREQLGWGSLDEGFEGNPYMEGLYADPARWSFHAQLHFHVEALADAGRVASGYWLWDRPPAERHHAFIPPLRAAGYVTAEEACMLERIMDVADRRCPPTLTVALDGPTPVIVRRIAERGRPYEQGIDAGWMDTHRAQYHAWWPTVDGPVWPIDITRTDVRDPAQLTALVDEIRRLAGVPG